MDRGKPQRSVDCDNSKGDYFHCIMRTDYKLVIDKEICQNERKEWIELCPVEFRKEDMIDYYTKFAMEYQLNNTGTK